METSAGPRVRCARNVCAALLATGVATHPDAPWTNAAANFADRAAVAKRYARLVRQMVSSADEHPGGELAGLFRRIPLTELPQACCSAVVVSAASIAIGRWRRSRTIRAC